MDLVHRSMRSLRKIMEQKNYNRVQKGYKTGMLVVGLWGLLTSCILIFLPGPIFFLVLSTNPISFHMELTI